MIYQEFTCIVLLLVGACWAGAHPRYVTIPIEDVEWMNTDLFAAPLVKAPVERPLYGRPAKRRIHVEPSRISRPTYVEEPPPTGFDNASDISEDNDSEQAGRVERQSGGGHHEHVDYGAHTGHHGAFGWYADFPVHKGSR